MTSTRRLLAGTLAACVLLLAACSESVEPIERLGRKAAEGEQEQEQGAAAAGAEGASAAPGPHTRWGLKAPLAFAPKPARKPVLPAAGPGLPSVVDRIPTDEKVVFITFDDGAERDPEFLKMAADLKLPISMFLTDSVASRGYDHFERLRDLGGTVQNHTLTHPNLRRLPYAKQRAEICGQQDRLKARFGTKPRLFRPPFGNYNDDTLRAAADCGVSSVVLWRASMQIHNLRYAEGDKLRPGDIVLAHFRGPGELKGSTITEMTTQMLRRIQEQGFRIGLLEDYL
ncbi:polysaccharide deacetylase family protein [Streptomyces sp. NPDC051219]|uniref:polysaccharide deacetylase family protein n=1 Tax=Streptomyces sp. NPDC051219 TaxID=3155283 RepID=UPI0034160FA4